jgi:adenylate cyclase
MQDVTNGFSSSPVNNQRKATDLINKVLPKNPANVLAHVVKGDTLRYGDPEGSLAEYNAVLDIHPNFAVVYGLKGTALTVAGGACETFSPVELALRLSPKDPFASGWHYNLCHAHVRGLQTFNQHEQPQLVSVRGPYRRLRGERATGAGKADVGRIV